jgi:hypothetical protein
VSRLLLLALLVLAALPAVAGAAVPPALGPEGRVYPLLGGGTEQTRTGIAATRLRDPGPATYLPLAGGGVAVFPIGGPSFSVGADGRGTVLPAAPDDDGAVYAAAADGGVLRLGEDRDRFARLDPGPRMWSVEPIPAAVPRSFVAQQLVALPGGYALVGLRRTWRIEGGTATAVAHPRFPSAATATADGTVLLTYLDRSGIVALPPGGGAAVELGADLPEETRGDHLIAMPDGTLLRTGLPGRRTAVLSPGATLEALLDRGNGLGDGAGGPASGARTVPFAATADGGLLMVDDEGAVRIAVPPGTARSLAAVAPATYDGLAGGAVTVSSTFAGTAAVEVRSGGAVLTRGTAAVGPGETAVALPGAPPPGRYTVALTVTAPDGREALHRMTVVTLERLSRAAAVQARRRFERRSHVGNGEGETYVDLRRCGRVDARTYSCQAVQVVVGRGITTRHLCVGIWTARLRPDGLQSRVREAPGRCRALGPVR